MQEELLVCYKTIGDLKHQLENAHETMERLTVTYNTETIRSATLREEVVNYQRRLSELEEKYEINRGANEDMENELTVLQQRMEELSRENSSIQESKALVVVEVTNQRNKITRLEQQLEDSEREKENLRLQLTAMHSKGDAEAHEISKQISQLSERSLTFQREKEDLERQLSQKHSETISLQRENDALKSQEYSSSTQKQLQSFFELGGDADLGPSAESTRFEFDNDDFEGGGTTVTTRTVKVKSSKKGRS